MFSRIILKLRLDIFGILQYSNAMEERFHLFIIVIAAIIAFVFFSQPVWRGDDMVAAFKDRCAKRGGVLIETKSLMGINYECASRLD